MCQDLFFNSEVHIKHRAWGSGYSYSSKRSEKRVVSETSGSWLSLEESGV
jgi:hypothetical protein